MVSFVCDECQDTVKKGKLDQHYRRCRSTFTCVDCQQEFGFPAFKSHSSCFTEEEKMTGKHYQQRVPDNNEKKNSKSPKNQHKNANVSNGNDTSNSVKEKSSSESNESKKESPSKSKKKSSKDEPSTITSDGKVKSPKSESKKAKSPSKEGKQDSKSPRNNDKQSSPRDDKSLFENFDIDDDTPKSPRKRKRESGERIPTSNLSPRKKIKTKSNLDIQIQEDLKKKIALYAHLKPHRVIKKLLKKAPNKSKKYGEARKDFVNICVSKVRDDLETIFEVLIKSHNIKDDIVTLTE